MEQTQGPIGSDFQTEPERPQRNQTGNIFSKHKGWWLILAILSLAVATAFPGRTEPTDILWASVVGAAFGMLAGAFLLAGFVWLCSLITRTGTTSVQFMCVVTVALGVFIASRVYRSVAERQHGGVSHLATQQPAMKSGNIEPPKANDLGASTVTESPMLFGRMGSYEDDRQSWKAREFQEDLKWGAMPRTELIQAAANGSPEARVALGRYCMSEWYGDNTNRSDWGQKAVLCFQKAASAGSMRALYELADCYRFGIGVTQDDVEAGKFLRNAADLGYAGAQFAIAVQYQTAKGVNKNPTEAFKWYVQAANQSHSGALLALGEMYEEGECVGRDRAKAMDCYTSAAQFDDGSVSPFSTIAFLAVERHARFCLEMLSDQGFGIPASRQEAVQIYRRAAAAGNAKAEYFLGRILAYGYGLASDRNESEVWNRKAAEAGHGYAQLLLGEQLVSGMEPNKTEGRQWLLKAASQGIEEAYKPLLSLGLDSFSVEIGFGKFRVWGSPLASDRDAGFYAYKQRSWTNALHLFEKAAKSGDADAQYALSVMYVLGQGVEVNEAKAAEWLAKVAVFPSDAALTEVGLKNLKSTNAWESAIAPLELTVAAVMGNNSAIEELQNRWDEGLGHQELVKHQPFSTNATDLEELLTGPLRGITAFRINATSPGKEAEADGLSRVELQTAVELRLRSAGIRIAPTDDLTAPVLDVNTQCFRGKIDVPIYAVHVSVSVQAAAVYRFRRVFVPIWSTETMGSCGTARIASVKDWVVGLVDQFANDYLKANPK